MAYALTTLQTDIRNYTEVDSTVLSDTIVNTSLKMLKIKFIEKQIMMTIDFMILQIWLLEIDM